MLNEEWINVYSSRDANSAYCAFEESFTKIYKNSFPFKNVPVKKLNSKPWLTAGLLNCIKIKNKLYRKQVQNRTDLNRATYTQYKNKLSKILKIAQRNYYANEIQQANNDMKKIWSIIGELLNKKSRDPLPKIFRDVGNTVDGEENIANGFNSFFSNVEANLARQIPPTNNHYSEFMGPRNHDNFFLNPTDKNEIEAIVKNFKSNKSAGIDEVSCRVLISVIDLISVPLAYIFNFSFTSGRVPDSLKIARITPIYKNGEQDLFTNYRPVSVLSCLSKILERLVHKRLYLFFSKYKLIKPNQFGFLENHSTALALTKIVDKITRELDAGETVIGTFLDLSKAFDTINHEILVGKLSHYGVRGVSSLWFKNYLTDRKQLVKIGNSISSMGSIGCGVPQGSILGPLLFIIYINDCVNVIKKSDVIMFADDTNHFASGRNMNQVVRLVNSELNLLSEWFKVNKLSLNTKKTQYIVFNKRHSTRDSRIFINGNLIEQVASTNFLGVTFDERLNWSEHSRVTTAKLARKIGIINHLRKSLPVKILPSLYSAFILPQLQYCNIVWGRNFEVHINPIVILQKKVIRLITNSYYLAHTHTLFKSLKMLTFHDLNKFQLGEFMYRFEKRLLPESFNAYFVYNSEVHGHNTRGRNQINIEYCRTVAKSFSVKIAGPRLWNSLPINLRNSASISIFKKNYKKMLLMNY